MRRFLINHRYKVLVITLVILLIGLITELSLSIHNSLGNEKLRVILFPTSSSSINKFLVIVSAVIRFLLFFTVQTNILSGIVLISYLTKNNQPKLMVNLKLNLVIWISLVGIIYFIFLFPLWTGKIFPNPSLTPLMDHTLWEQVWILTPALILHLIIPVNYCLIYFLFEKNISSENNSLLAFKKDLFKKYKVWIYPFVYFILCIVISQNNFYFLGDNFLDYSERPAIWYPFFQQGALMICVYVFIFYSLLLLIATLLYFISKWYIHRDKRASLIKK